MRCRGARQTLQGAFHTSSTSNLILIFFYENGYRSMRTFHFFVPVKRTSTFPRLNYLCRQICFLFCFLLPAQKLFHSQAETEALCLSTKSLSEVQSCGGSSSNTISRPAEDSLLPACGGAFALGGNNTRRARDLYKSRVLYVCVCVCTCLGIFVGT